MLDSAIVDHRDARRSDAVADSSRECRRALAVEVAFEAVANSLVEQDSRPAGAEHHRHLAGRRGDGFEIGQRLAERNVDRTVPLGFFEQASVEIAAAQAVIAGLAASVLLRDDLDAETHERTDVRGDETMVADDV